MKKLILSIVLACCFSARFLEASAPEYAAKSLYYLCRGGATLSAFVKIPDALLSLYCGLKVKSFKKDPERLCKELHAELNLPSKTKAFLEEKLREHKLEPSEHLCIEWASIPEPGTFSNIISLAPENVKELEGALGQQNDPAAQAVVLRYSALLDHELGHRVHLDWIVDPCVTTMNAIALHCANTALLKKIYPSIYSPQTAKGYILSSLCLSGTTILNIAIAHVSHWLLRKFMEYRADGHAISSAKTAKDAQRLYALSDHFKPSKRKGCIYDSLVEDLKRTTSATNYSYFDSRSFMLHITRKKLEKRYAEQKPQEEMSSWIEKQTDLIDESYDWRFFFHDPARVHPTPNSRSNRFLNAAQAIETQQKCANAKA